MKESNSLIKLFRINSSIKKIVKVFLPQKTIDGIRRYLKRKNKTRIYFDDKLVVIDKDFMKVDGVVPVSYWDYTPNFGDTIGPFLISQITRKPVLNIFDSSKPGIMAVGSIIQSIDRKNMIIWGSGLIDKPTDEVINRLKAYNPIVLSVRGKETAKYLLKAGIKVPNESAFGDPALILPLFYKPIISNVKRIGVCPHFSHKSNFLNISDGKGDSLKLIDVQSDMKSVINEISSSSVCISTSLHGLIIAQAYNIPWVWLEISDNNLIGNDFKFKDFFSTLNTDQVSHLRINLDQIKNIDYEMLAKKATLPDKLYDEKNILDVLNKHLKTSIE